MPRKSVPSCKEPPIVKIILEPGEYYVAPTEQIIHDATFVNNEDITITILGYFR